MTPFQHTTKALCIWSFFGLILASCSDGKGGLEPEEQTLELSYIAWACDCANWATQEDMDRAHEDSLAYYCVFVEPASAEVALPDSLGWSRDVIRFTGQFYREKGFPKGYFSHQDPLPAKVFRYRRYEVIESHYSDYQDE